MCDSSLCGVFGSSLPLAGFYLYGIWGMDHKGALYFALTHVINFANFKTSASEIMTLSLVLAINPRFGLTSKPT